MTNEPKSSSGGFLASVLETLGNLFGPSKTALRRIEVIKSSTDNLYLNRVHNAGTVEGSIAIAANGLKLTKSSLKSLFNLRLFRQNKGVLEPQHERAFAEVMKSQGPSPFVLDIGSRHGFYAAWGKLARPGARCVFITPERRDMAIAQKNFELNRMPLQAMRAYVGLNGGRTVEGIEVLTIDEITKKLRADYVAVMVADIEGYELELLHGAKPLMVDRVLDYILLSTHSESLHKECHKFLEELRYTFVANVAPSQAYGNDGLILARRKELRTGVDKIDISRRA